MAGRLAILVWVLALAGCVSAAQSIPEPGQIKVTDDPYRPYREYTTGEIKSANAVGVGAKQLVGRIDRTTGALTTVLQFEIAYQAYARRHYETARNAKAEVLAFNQVQKTARCRPGADCVYGEQFIVTLPEAHLRAAGPEGYSVKVFARSGPDVLVALPKEMIDSLLARIDADRNTKKT